MQTRNILRILLVTVVILLVPFVAMRFTHEVNWSPADFIAAGLLLFSTGLAYEFLAAKMGKGYRTAVGLAVLTALMVIWADLAVGIVGEHNPANKWYLGVVAVGIVGTIIARLRARAMSHTLFAMAIAQALVTAIALLISPPHAPATVFGVLRGNAFLITLFITSALLFRRASHQNELQSRA